LRTVAEYLERAAEFESLAAAASVDTLRKRFADVAACYRLLAEERERLVACGSIDGEALVSPPAHFEGDTHL
jgi:hypothetical protein